jgi:NADH-quinone oxidoreductase subunit B
MFPVDDVPMGRDGLIRSERMAADQKIPEGVMVTRLEELVNWGRKYSLWPMPFGTACCAIEFMGTVSSEYDISRFGAELVRFSPRQADLMLVLGTINYKIAPVLQRIYNQMCEPKWVVAVGACATCGGFYDNYHVVQGIDQIVPCDVYVAGCPPRPENILEAVVKLQELITKGNVDRPNRRRFEAIQAGYTFEYVPPPIPAPHAGANVRTSIEGPDVVVNTMTTPAPHVDHQAPKPGEEDLFASWTV